MTAGCTRLAALFGVALAALAATGCGSSSNKPSGPPLKSATFTTIVPKGFKQGNCSPDILVCLDSQQSMSITAGPAPVAQIGAQKVSQPVPDSQLESEARSEISKDNGTNVQLKSETVSGSHAVYATYAVPGQGLDGNNDAQAVVNHGGSTYTIYVSAHTGSDSGPVPNADALFKNTFLPAFNDVLKAWTWR